jgi:hypothetical protein
MQGSAHQRIAIRDFGATPVSVHHAPRHRGSWKNQTLGQSRSWRHLGGLLARRLQSGFVIRARAKTAIRYQELSLSIPFERSLISGKMRRETHEFHLLKSGACEADPPCGIAHMDGENR